MMKKIYKFSPLEMITQDSDYRKAKNLFQILNATYNFLCNKFHNDLFLFKNRFDKNDIDFCNQSFKAVVDSYNQGDVCESIERLRQILIEDNKWILGESTLKKGSITYRLRNPDTKSDGITRKYDLFSPNDLFHMPFDLINKQSSQRYSISGFPCLYLGQSIYDCWEETRRPDLEKVNYAAFKNMQDLVLLTLDCPNKIEDNKDLAKFYMFALSTKYISLEEDDSAFKFQYVFPELTLLILVKEMAKHHEKKDKVPYVGIRYISSRYYEEGLDMWQVKPVFYNYVLPIQNYSETGHCSVLKDMFKVSNVRAVFHNLISQAVLPYSSIRRNGYDLSYFRRLELDIEKTGKGEFKHIKD